MGAQEASSDCCGLGKSARAPKIKKRKKHVDGQVVTSSHPSHTNQISALNRVLGQIEGIKRMIENRRYCPEILIQTRAAVSAVKAVEMRILETHLRHCVSEVMADKNAPESEAKVRELVSVLSRF